MSQEMREAITLENQGQKIFGILHRPKEGSGPFPAIVCCHGFGSHKVGKYRFYVEFAKEMAEKGFVVARFDFRGAGDSEGVFDEMTVSGEVSDARTVLDHVRSLPFVNSERVGLLGRSLGGLIATLTAIEVGNVSSLCLWSPVFSSEEWKQRAAQAQDPALSLAERDRLSRVNGHRPSRRFLQEFFAIDLTKTLPKINNTPLLLLHGEEDTTVAMYHSEHYEAVRREGGATTELVRFPKSDHSFSEDEERNEALARTCAWFERTLR